MAGTRENMLAETVTAKMSKAEKAMVKRRAAERGVSVSEWGRTVMVEAAAGLDPQVRFLATEAQAIRSILVEAIKPMLPGGSKEEKDGALMSVLQSADKKAPALSRARWEKFATELCGGNA